MILRLGPWGGVDAVESATLEWVCWFEKSLRRESIGNIPDAEAERRCRAQNKEAAVAA